ncbi:MAG: hypothetical protein LBU16_08900 [Treponema sp.]|nr:hypothetical protein [Treponema sp.]
MKSGFKYDVLRQAVSVVITNHELLPLEQGCLNYYELWPQVEEYQRISWSQRRRLLADYWEKHSAATPRPPWAMPGKRGRVEIQQALAEKERENEELRRKLREAGIDPRQSPAPDGSSKACKGTKTTA